MARSKRYKALAQKIDPTKSYTVDEALQLLTEAPVKFDAGVELHCRLGIDTKKSEQLVRGTVVLPHGTGKVTRVAAFVSEAKVAEAKEAGADLIGTDEVIEQIKQTGKCDFDIAVASPDMMRKLGAVAKILGQQGLMPSPKTETVGPNVKEMVQQLKAGKVAFRNDDGGNVHFLVGRVSFPVQQLKENVTTIIEALRRVKPSESKGVYLMNCTLASSMGPGVRLTVE